MGYWHCGRGRVGELPMPTHAHRDSDTEQNRSSAPVHVCVKLKDKSIVKRVRGTVATWQRATSHARRPENRSPPALQSGGDGDGGGGSMR